MEIEEQVEEAKEVLADGGLVIFPTETAYGIAADALNHDAVKKVFEAKQRPRSKGLTVIVKDLRQAERHANLSEEEKKVAEELMPGPLTLVTEKTDEVPDNLNRDFVFRIPSSEVARELASGFPITATSANTAGEDTSYQVEDISDELRDSVDYILDEGELEVSGTSTIAEVNNGEVVIHRRGPVTREQLEEVL